MKQENIQPIQDSVTEIEEAGVKNVSKSKTSFSSKVIIVLTLLVVSLLIFGGVYWQMERGYEKDVSKKSNQSTTVKLLEKDLDRIFFSAPVFESDGKITQRIVSILENGKDLRFYGKTIDIREKFYIPAPSICKKTSKVVFNSESDDKLGIVMQDLNFNETKGVQVFGMNYICPSFSPRGDKIVAIEIDMSNYSSLNSDVFMVAIETESNRVLYRKKLNRTLYFPQFSPDGEWTIYGDFKSANPAIYKKKIHTGTDYDPKDNTLLCSVKASKTSFLVSPTRDILCKIENISFEGKIKPEIALVDTNDGSVKSIEIDNFDNDGNILTLISWSSDENFVYLQKLNERTNIISLVKLNVATGKFSEIFTFTTLDLSKVNSDVIKDDGERDRIFFISGMEIMSVLEDGTNICHHGIIKEGDRIKEIQSDKRTKKFLFNLTPKGKSLSTVHIQDWNSSELSKTPLFNEGQSEYASFIPNSENFALVSNRHSFKNFMVPNDNGQNLVNIIPADLRVSMSIRPQFSHDGKSVICLCNDEEPRGFYEIATDGKSTAKNIYETYGSFDSFLVSPVDKRIFAMYGRWSFFIFDPKGAGKTIAKGIEIVEDEKISSFKLISWSSNGRFVYMEKEDSSSNRTLVKLEIDTGKITKIYEITK